MMSACSADTEKGEGNIPFAFCFLDADRLHADLAFPVGE